MRGTSSQKRTRAHTQTHGHAPSETTHTGGHHGWWSHACRGSSGSSRRVRRSSRGRRRRTACLGPRGLPAVLGGNSMSALRVRYTIDGRFLVSDRGKKIVQSPARSIPRAPARCVRSHGAGRSRVNAARPHAHLRAPPKFHPRVRLSLSSRGSRHEALVTRAIVRWGAMGRGRGGVGALTGSPLAPSKPCGQAATPPPAWWLVTLPNITS